MEVALCLSVSGLNTSTSPSADLRGLASCLGVASICAFCFFLPRSQKLLEEKRE